MSTPGSAEIRRLVSVGNVVVDIVARVPSLPERGGDVLATDSGLAVGGGFNVLLASVRQGLAAAYGGAHGTGPFGDLARSVLTTSGVDVLLGPVARFDTGYDVALTDDGGERTFITAPGAEAMLTPELIARVPVTRHDAVYVSGYSLVRSPNRETICGWLQSLPDDVTVIVDPGPLIGDIPPQVYEIVRARATWWSCNLREASIATGLEKPADAIRALLDGADAGGVIVRLGSEGALIATADGGVAHIPGFAVEMIDTNGAGDAHVGGFIAALAHGASATAATRRANACAALAVTRRGPATAPTREEVDALLARQE